MARGSVNSIPYIYVREKPKNSSLNVNATQILYTLLYQDPSYRRYKP